MRISDWSSDVCSSDLYLVVPENLVDAVSAAQGALGAQPTAMIQPVLAAFIDESHFATHVRRMRRLYATRQAALVAAAGRHLCDFLPVSPDYTGLLPMASIGRAPCWDNVGTNR